VRQDLIAHPDGQAAWAERLGTVLADVAKDVDAIREH
jgi:predicted N-formylglutamate amidohydrolase